jgi:hypothetical protein
MRIVDAVIELGLPLQINSTVSRLTLPRIAELADVVGRVRGVAFAGVRSHGRPLRRGSPVRLRPAVAAFDRRRSGRLVAGCVPAGLGLDGRRAPHVIVPGVIDLPERSAYSGR